MARSPAVPLGHAQKAGGATDRTLTTGGHVSAHRKSTTVQWAGTRGYMLGFIHFAGCHTDFRNSMNNNGENMRLYSYFLWFLYRHPNPLESGSQQKRIHSYVHIDNKQCKKHFEIFEIFI